VTALDSERARLRSGSLMTARMAIGGALVPELPRATGVGPDFVRIVGRCNPFFSHFPRFFFIFWRSDVSHKNLRSEIFFSLFPEIGLDVSLSDVIGHYPTLFLRSDISSF